MCNRIFARCIIFCKVRPLVLDDVRRCVDECEVLNSTPVLRADHPRSECRSEFPAVELRPRALLNETSTVFCNRIYAILVAAVQPVTLLTMHTIQSFANSQYKSKIVLGAASYSNANGFRIVRYFDKDPIFAAPILRLFGLRSYWQYNRK